MTIEVKYIPSAMNLEPTVKGQRFMSRWGGRFINSCAKCWKHTEMQGTSNKRCAWCEVLPE